MDFGIIIPIPQSTSRKNEIPFHNPIHWENFCIPHSILQSLVLAVAIPIPNPNPQEMVDYEHWSFPEYFSKENRNRTCARTSAVMSNSKFPGAIFEKLKTAGATSWIFKISKHTCFQKWCLFHVVLAFSILKTNFSQNKLIQLTFAPFQLPQHKIIVAGFAWMAQEASTTGQIRAFR